MTVSSLPAPKSDRQDRPQGTRRPLSAIEIEPSESQAGIANETERPGEAKQGPTEGDRAPLRARHVAVIGGGAAGMASAIAAARAGSSVTLIEATPKLGGTMSNALLHTLAGLYDGDGHHVNQGLAQELENRLISADPEHVRPRKMAKLWVLSVDPSVYQQVTSDWVSKEPNIEIRLGAHVTKVLCQQQRVREIEVFHAESTEVMAVDALIDCTGSGAALRLIDPGLHWTDAQDSAGGLIFCLRDVRPGALRFPRRVGVLRALREAARDGRLPANCAHAWADAGIAPDEVYVKLFVPLHGDWNDCVPQLTENARNDQAAVVQFLRTLSDFRDAKVTRSGILGVRDGGRVRAERTLTGADVLAGRRFDDVACRCAWPIELWTPDRGVEIQYLPAGTIYDIPMSALKVMGITNAWTAGRSLCADNRAQASARCVGTCWAMGAAVGNAAALSHDERRFPEDPR